MRGETTSKRASEHAHLARQTQVQRGIAPCNQAVPDNVPAEGHTTMQPQTNKQGVATYLHMESILIGSPVMPREAAILELAE